MTLKRYFIIFIFSLLAIRPVSAQLDPRVKALGTMALYGTVGGALLGTAALAFDAEGRAVAKGASLGLYAGLLFGGYVVASHAYRKYKSEHPTPKDNYYPGVNSPYEQGEAAGGYQETPEEGYRWNPVREMNSQRLKDQELDPQWTLKNKKTPIEVFLPVLQMSF